MEKSIGDLMGELDLRLKLHEALKADDEAEIKRLEHLIYELAKEEAADSASDG